MIPSCQPWSRGSVPSARAARESKDPEADGESRAAAGPRPSGLTPAALTPLPTRGRRGREQASLHFSHFFPDEGRDLRNNDSEAGTEQ